MKFFNQTHIRTVNNSFSFFALNGYKWFQWKIMLHWMSRKCHFHFWAKNVVFQNSEFEFWKFQDFCTDLLWTFCFTIKWNFMTDKNWLRNGELNFRHSLFTYRCNVSCPWVCKLHIMYCKRYCVFFIQKFCLLFLSDNNARFKIL